MVMVAVFWHAKVLLLVEYLEKSYTISEAYCADLFRQLREKEHLGWEADKTIALPSGHCPSPQVQNSHGCHPGLQV